MNHNNFYYNFKTDQGIKRKINRYKTVRDKIVKIKATITFLIRCRKSGIIPKFIKNSTKNISNLFEKNETHTTQRSTSGFVQSLQNKILNLAIKEKHESF